LPPGSPQGVVALQIRPGAAPEIHAIPVLLRRIGNLRAATAHRRISCGTDENTELMNILRFVYVLLTACSLKWC